ncbi:MAG: hypothetical protein OXB84_03405 [Halobacteriovoraceae bacterium]|nr:hypothetical protein [Halobacteriovoraceae bacterium]
MMGSTFIYLLLSIFSPVDAGSTNHYIPEAYMKIAENMESQYVEFMLNKMKETVSKNNPDGPAMSYYRSLLTREQATRLVRSNSNFGIKKMILDQIYPQRLRNKKIYENHLRMQKRELYERHQRP